MYEQRQQGVKVRDWGCNQDPQIKQQNGGSTPPNPAKLNLEVAHDTKQCTLQ